MQRIVSKEAKSWGLISDPIVEFECNVHRKETTHYFLAGTPIPSSCPNEKYVVIAAQTVGIPCKVLSYLR